MIWDVSPVFFSIGPLAIRYYSLLFALTFLGGLQMRRALRNGRVASSRPPALETDSMTTKNPATKRGSKKRREK